MTGRYARTTEVSSGKSRAEIEGFSDVPRWAIVVGMITFILSVCVVL